MALVGLPAALIALWSLVELVRALRPARTELVDGPAQAEAPASSTPVLV